MTTANESTPTKQVFRFDTNGGSLSQSPLVYRPPSSNSSSSNSNDTQSLSSSRPRSSTLCSSYGETIKKELQDIEKSRKKSQQTDDHQMAKSEDQPEPATIEK